MNLRNSITVGTLSAALLLTLSACTEDETPTTEPSKEITLRIAVGTQPADQALAHVYANALKAEGYKASLNKPAANPYQQVVDGKADLALDQADKALNLVADPAAITGEDQVLSAEESQSLRSAINDAQGEVSALELSPADAGKVLVMSQAQATLHKVDSVETLIAACADLTIISDEANAESLATSMKDAGCEKPKISVEETANLAAKLRTSVDSAVVLSAGNAVISDEGFYSIPGSANFFNAENYLLLADSEVDDKARAQLDKITGEFSQQSLVDLNRMVSQEDGLSPEQAAARWEWIIEE